MLLTYAENKRKNNCNVYYVDFSASPHRHKAAKEGKCWPNIKNSSSLKLKCLQLINRLYGVMSFLTKLWEIQMLMSLVKLFWSVFVNVDFNNKVKATWRKTKPRKWALLTAFFAAFFNFNKIYLQFVIFYRKEKIPHVSSTVGLKNEDVLKNLTHFTFYVIVFSNRFIDKSNMVTLPNPVFISWYRSRKVKYVYINYFGRVYPSVCK